MNGDAAITLLVGRLGDRTELRASILAEMTLAQTVLEGGEVLPWFLLSEDYPLTIAVNERKVPLPTDFLREHEDGVLEVTNSQGIEIELQKGDYDDLIDFYENDTTADVPEAYALVGEYFNLFPIPLVILPLTLSKYYKKTAAPTDTAAENVWLKHAADVLIAETGVVMAGQYLQNGEMSQLFIAQRLVARTRLDNQNTAREEANRPRNMGDN